MAFPMILSKYQKSGLPLPVVDSEPRGINRMRVRQDTEKLEWTQLDNRNIGPLIDVVVQ